MSCNSCAKSFSFLRKEKGCPGCGFSYCSNCLENKVFVKKLNTVAKVCAKCKKSSGADEHKKIEPPDAYYRRIGVTEENISSNNTSALEPGNTIDHEIHNRLQKLKMESDNIMSAVQKTTEAEIAQRLQNIKSEIPSTSDAELQTRLAKLKGIPASIVTSKAVIPAPDLRTEQEQADDLMRQYIEQSQIDTKYDNEFDEVINTIEARMQKLKGSTSVTADQGIKPVVENSSEDEDEIIKKLIEKAKVENSMEADFSPSTNDELPFCEICNEDARMRCLGCRYLFCKGCFLEHKDDDDGCNRYEPYEPPKST